MATGDIGIDLGTRNSLVYTTGRGMILSEPTIVVYDRNAERIRMIGEEAQSLTGHSLSGFELVRPIRDGMITDYIVLEKLLKYFITKAMGRNAFRKPRISICVPGSITDIGRKALEEASYLAGARKVFFVRSPLAAALGSELDISKPAGNLVVDIGAGSTDVAVLTMYGMAVSGTIRVGSDALNRSIISYVRKVHNLFIGEDLAETIKLNIGAAFEEKHTRSMEVKGRNVITGLPKVVTLTSEDVREAITDTTGQILGLIRQVLEKTPPELASDIVDRGIVLSGGGALLPGFDHLVEDETGISTMTMPNAMVSTVMGTARYAQIATER